MSLNLFVGHKRELQQYQEFLTRVNPWVLVIRGLGGSGKSTLLDELERQTSREDTCVVRIDFAQETLRKDYLTFLEDVSDQVAPHCDSERNYELKKSIAAGRYEIGKRIASGNTTIENLEQSINAGADAEISKASLNIDMSEASRQETRRQMREIAREKFYAQLRTFGKQRLVIMLDTCEWLNEETAEAEAARWAGTELVKGLSSRMRNQGKACYVVMTSRVRLQLEDINKVETTLKMLERAEAKQYLEAMEVNDPMIQDYLYNMTYGHPHSIAIISDIWEENWDRPLSATDLPRLRGLFYERAIQDIVDKDVLKRLLKPPLDELTRYGVLLRRFNLPLLQAVFDKWLPETEASDRFSQLIRYPHVESLGDFNYGFHKLLREILSRYILATEPKKWLEYHQAALKFLTRVALRTPDWYYHLLACDEEKGVSYWNEIKAREPREYIDALREVACDKTLTLRPDTMQGMDIHSDAFGNIA